MSDPRIDRRPTNGRVEFSGINYVYTPKANFTGGDRFVVSWANAPDGTRVTLTVGVRIVPPGTAAPTINRSTSQAAGASPRSSGTCRTMGAGIHGQDSRYGADSMTVSRNYRCSGQWDNVRSMTLDTPPSHGRVEFAGNRHTYIPNPDYVGADSYIYTVAHSRGRISITVNVSVIP